MTQFNLLPDVKTQYIQAQRLKRSVISGSIIVSIAVLAIFILLLLYVDVAQKKHISDINSDIVSNTAQLSHDTNLNKILTVQNQMQTLPQIEAQNPVSARIFNYMTQLTPVKASVSSLNVDFTQNQITVTGSADSLATVNQFVDTIKFTTYKAANASNTPAFSTVVLSSFGYGKSVGGQPANYTITFNFDPTIFSSANNTNLTVPQITSTRSIISQPTDLFQNSTTSTNKGT